MTDAERRELVVLPPVLDDPVFSDPDDDAVPSATPLRHDPHEFAALYMRHRWSFALHARRFLSDQRDIDEVVQEGFLKLFLALPELETELQALAYARRTITNLCIDRYRADRRRPRLVDLETVPVDALLDGDDDDPVVAAEDAAFVREALALLSPLHREALVKREVEEKPLPQIAAELDIPVEQVKHVLHRARKALRRLLVGTQVEPGVDLDVATVLAVNRERLSTVAKPTGAAALALLLVLAGVLGLRGARTSARPEAQLPTASSLPNLLGEPPSAGLAAPPAAPATPAHTLSGPAPHRAAPKTTRSPVKTARPAAAVPVKRPPTGTTVPATGGTASGGGSTPAVPPAVPPPVVGPPVAAPATEPATSHLALSGLLASTSAPSLEGATTFSHDSGAEAAFTRFVAPTAHGTLVLAQTFTSASDGSLTYVADAALPVDGASVPAQLAVPQQSAARNADGTVAVTLATTFALPTAAPGELPTSDRFVVQAVYAPDLRTILAERVVVGGPSDPLTPLAAPAAGPAKGGSDSAPPSATVRNAPASPTVPSGRENPVGRDQDPLPSS